MRCIKDAAHSRAALSSQQRVLILPASHASRTRQRRTCSKSLFLLRRHGTTRNSMQRGRSHMPHARASATAFSTRFYPRRRGPLRASSAYCTAQKTNQWRGRMKRARRDGRCAERRPYRLAFHRDMGRGELHQLPHPRQYRSRGGGNEQRERREVDAALHPRGIG